MDFICILQCCGQPSAFLETGLWLSLIHIYSDDGKQVLSEINLSVKAGENVALVGPSGGGKTTLCNLIPRFYDVTEGRILIDGQAVSYTHLDVYKRQPFPHHVQFCVLFTMWGPAAKRASERPYPKAALH